MNDYGQDLRFGLSLDPEARNYDATVRSAQQAEALGLDYVALQDHPYSPDHLDLWTTLTHITASTERIGVLPDVLDLQLRLTPMVAKAAASLDVIAPGRVRLGVGAGGIPGGIASLGQHPVTGANAVDLAESAISVLRTALHGGVVRAATAQHQIPGYEAGPARPAGVPIWLGGQQPRMLGVVGRVSDGWISPLNIYVPPDTVLERQRLIDASAVDAGRRPADIRRIYNVIGSIGSDGPTGLVGSTDHWVRTLSSWALVLGFDTFIFWPVSDVVGQLDLFGREVVPAVRARVSAARADLRSEEGSDEVVQ